MLINIKKTLLTCLFAAPLFANSALDNIKSKPASYAKDLFLWQIMQNEDLSEGELWQAFMLTKKPKNEHIEILINKNKTLTTKNDSPQSAIDQFSFNFWINFKDNRQAYIEKLAVLSPHKAQLVAMSIADTKTLNSVDGDTFVELNIWSSSPQYRKEKLNFAPRTSVCKNINLARLVKKALYSQSEILLKSLDECETNDPEALFYLGINDYSRKFNEKASQFFIRAAIYAKTIEDKERANYWAYKAGGNEIYLKNAANSGAYYYGALARVELNLGLKEPMTFEGYNKDAKPLDINMSDPFEEKLKTKYLKELSKSKLNELEESARQIGYEPLWAKIKTLQGGSKYIYIEPYLQFMKNESLENKAMWLAIARQESEFFPNDVSSAFAIGVMQVIPILAKDLNPNVKPLDLLNPSVNVPLAISHFNNLKNMFGAPAYVAIAFNAGPGYLKRLKAKNHFDSQDKLLALETMDYDETRQYVKRVLLNYTIYSDLLGVPVNKKLILQNPFLPFHTLR